jgi:O-antigen/teichoic acid export membrane protein
MNPLSRFRGAALGGVLDQALTSAENFAIGIILIRNCPKAEYGVFALGYGILVLAWSLIASLITAQLPAVLSKGSPSQEERRAECSALLRSMLVACLATTGGGAIVVVLLVQFDIVAPQELQYWLLLSLALPGMCLRDFMRRYFFQERSEKLAVAMDAAALVLTIAALGTLAVLHAGHLNSYAAGTAVGGLAVGSWGIVAAGLAPRTPGIGSIATTWHAGRWNVGATLVSWIQNQAYTFFVTAMLGLAGLAATNAPRVLLTPITLLSTGLALPLLPRFASQKTNLQSVVGARSAIALFALTLGFVGSYLLALWLARGAVLPLVLGSRYSDVWPCMVAWAVANVFTNIRIYYSTFLLAKGGFRQLATANILSAVVVLSLTAPLIARFGALGSVYSLAAGEFLFGMATWHQCRVVAAALLRKEPSPA